MIPVVTIPNSVSIRPDLSVNKKNLSYAPIEIVVSTWTLFCCDHTTALHWSIKAQFVETTDDASR